MDNDDLTFGLVDYYYVCASWLVHKIAYAKLCPSRRDVGRPNQIYIYIYMYRLYKPFPFTNVYELNQIGFAMLLIIKRQQQTAIIATTKIIYDIYIVQQPKIISFLF